MTEKPVAIFLTRNLPPLQGGMERLNQQIAITLQTRYKLIVVGPKGCREHLPDTIDVYQVPFRSLSVFIVWSSILAIRLSRKHRSVIAVGGSGLMGPALRMMGNRVRTIVYVHGLDLMVRNHVYRWLWLPSLRKLDLAIANSRATADIAARLGVARRRIRVVHPGTYLTTLPRSPHSTFRTRHDLRFSRVLLFVGRNTRRKGLNEFITNALPEIVNRFPRTVLTVIGDNAPNSLDSASRRNPCDLLDAARSAHLESHVKLIGVCTDAELHEAYLTADVHVFPVRDVPGDIEGFGMVAIEAAAHGLPTVAFAVGGVPDAVEHGTSGFLVSPNDYPEFASAVCRLLESGVSSTLSRAARDFATRFDWQIFRKTLLGAISDTSADKFHSSIREGHAVLDLASRTMKARKIEHILRLEPKNREIRMLEVGTGSGGIAAYFSNHKTLRCAVDAVDTSDTRQIRAGFRFKVVDDVILPYENGAFDIVLSNHVIEHVGETAAQVAHLQELRRVLHHAGKAYLATPNRWQLVEPHYRLLFLSWLPPSWRTSYLTFRRRGVVYDCNPLSVLDLERLLARSGFEYSHEHQSGILATYEIEQPDSFIYLHLLRKLPRCVFVWTRRCVPTLIYTLRHATK